MLMAARRMSPDTLMVVLAVMLALALLAALLTGPVMISPARLLDILTNPTLAANQQDLLILSAIRLPRLLLGATIGAALARPCRVCFAIRWLTRR